MRSLSLVVLSLFLVSPDLRANQCVDLMSRGPSFLTKVRLGQLSYKGKLKPVVTELMRLHRIHQDRTLNAAEKAYLDNLTLSLQKVVARLESQSGRSTFYSHFLLGLSKGPTIMYELLKDSELINNNQESYVRSTKTIQGNKVSEVIETNAYYSKSGPVYLEFTQNFLNYNGSTRVMSSETKGVFLRFTSTEAHQTFLKKYARAFYEVDMPKLLEAAKEEYSISDGITQAYDVNVAISGSHSTRFEMRTVFDRIHEDSQFSLEFQKVAKFLKAFTISEQFFRDFPELIDGN